MDLKQLRYFVAVARELHFARAAERVGIDQSVLSRQIRALERGVGVRLLWRTTRCTRLTGAGAVFLEKAGSVLEAVDGMVRETRRAGREGEGRGADGSRRS